MKVQNSEGMHTIKASVVHSIKCHRDAYFLKIVSSAYLPKASLMHTCLRKFQLCKFPKQLQGCNIYFKKIQRSIPFSMLVGRIPFLKSFRGA